MDSSTAALNASKWLLAFAGIWIVLAALAETDDGGEVAAAMAALIATSATFVFLPDVINQLGFGSNN